MKQSLKIVINKEYERLVRPLTTEEFENLLSDIKKDNRIYVPIITNKSGCLLDGHHRYRIAQRLAIENFPVKQIEFHEPLEEKLFVIRCNKNRRHLDIADRAFLANEESKILSEIAKKTQTEKAGTRATTNKGKRKNLIEESLDKSTLASFDANTKRKSRRKSASPEKTQKRRQNKSSYKAGKSQGLSAKTLERYQYLERYDPELFKRVNDKKIKISKAYKLLQQKKERERLEREALLASKSQEDSTTPLVGCLDIESPNLPVKDNSVDLIFTDPPYDRDNLYLYKVLGNVAARVLKPGGSLVAYAGTYALPEIFQLVLSNPSLTFWWQIILKHTGSFKRMYKQRIVVMQKPLLWFIKGEKSNAPDEIADYIVSEPPDKLTHDWQQSSVEAEYVIKHLTLEKQLVYDPFAGSGTTALAALKLNRIQITHDKDASTATRANQRLLEFINGRSSM